MAGMEVSDARRLKALGDEYPKLKRLLAEAMLDNAMPRNVAAKTVAPGTPSGRSSRRPQASAGHPGAVGAAASSEAALVAGFPS